MAIDIMNPAALRARFAELGETRNEALVISEPLRQKRDRILGAAEAEARDLAVQIKTAEDGLFEIDQERALIARALGGRTSEA